MFSLENCLVSTYLICFSIWFHKKMLETLYGTLKKLPTEKQISMLLWWSEEIQINLVELFCEMIIRNGL